MEIRKPSIAPLHDVVSDVSKARRRCGMPACWLDTLCRLVEQIRYRSSTRLAELEIAELNAGDIQAVAAELRRIPSLSHRPRNRPLHHQSPRLVRAR